MQESDLPRCGLSDCESIFLGRGNDPPGRMARALSPKLRFVPEGLRGQARQDILGRLRAYNRERIGPVDRRPMTLTLHDDATLIGGLAGETFMGWLTIDMLWVEPAFRGRGHAMALLEEAEQEARRRGATDCVLDTFSFQAPGFYRKRGYREFGPARRLSRGPSPPLHDEELMSLPSNRKSSSPSEAPQEPFKRAVASCMRAMARTPELEVSFAPDKPNVTGFGETAKAPTTGAAAQAQPPRGGHRPGARRFHGAEARLPRFGDAPPAAARGASGSHRVRGRGAGPGRGHRGRDAWMASPRTSRPCWRIATTAATSPRSRIGPMRRSKMRWP